MGLFSFIKEAGAKIFGGSAQAATADKLKEEVKGHGFNADWRPALDDLLTRRCFSRVSNASRS